MNNKLPLLMILPFSWASAEPFIQPLLPFFALTLVIVLADLRFGIRKARYRRQRIRFSKAVRRTVGKFIDYICWIFLAVSFDMALAEPMGIPLFRTICLLVVFGCELQSCYVNYFASKGKKVRINVFKFFKSKTELIDIEDDNR